MKTKTKNPSEHQEQVTLINWFRLTYPKFIMFSVPNGGNRDLIEAKRLKDEGLTAGIPDLCIILNDKVVFVEMKTRTGKLNEAQKKIIPKIERLGHLVIIGHGFIDAKNKIEELLNESK